MLTIMHEIGKHRNPETGDYNLDAFKIVGKSKNMKSWIELLERVHLRVEKDLSIILESIL